MIILGSGAVYDQKYNISKVKEEEFVNHLPLDQHALYRHTVARLIEGNNKIVDLRLFGIFGQYEDYAIRFISNAICKTLFDLPITIKQNRKFDYIYVKDLPFILDYFINNSAKHKSYNITPDKSVELLDLAKEIKRISGTKLPIIIKKEGLGLEYSGNNARLHKEIKDFQFTAHALAIQQLYDWYSEHKYVINKKILLIDK